MVPQRSNDDAENRLPAPVRALLAGRTDRDRAWLERAVVLSLGTASIGFALDGPSTLPDAPDAAATQGLTALPILLAALGFFAGARAPTGRHVLRINVLAGVGALLVAFLFATQRFLNWIAYALIHWPALFAGPLLALFWWSSLVRLRTLHETPSAETPILARIELGRWLLIVAVIVATLLLLAIPLSLSTAGSGPDFDGSTELALDAIVAARAGPWIAVGIAFALGAGFLLRGRRQRDRLYAWLWAVRDGDVPDWTLVPIADALPSDSARPRLLHAAKPERLLVRNEGASPYRDEHRHGVAVVTLERRVLLRPEAHWPRRALIRWSVAVGLYGLPPLLFAVGLLTSALPVVLLVLLAAFPVTVHSVYEIRQRSRRQERNPGGNDTIDSSDDDPRWLGGRLGAEAPVAFMLGLLVPGFLFLVFASTF